MDNITTQATNLTTKTTELKNEEHSERYYATIAKLKAQKANEDKAIASFLAEKDPSAVAPQKRSLKETQIQQLRAQFEESLSDLLKDSPYLSRMDKPALPLLGREKELSLLREALLKERMRNVIVTGLPGSGKTALVQEMAARDSENAYLQFSIAASEAGTQFRGQFEERINSVFSRISAINRKYKGVAQIIVFIDEIHLMYRAGAVEGGLMDLANILKTYLASDALSVIGATTNDEYERTIATDGALERRFTHFTLHLLDPDSVLHILQNFAKGRLTNAELVHLYYSCRGLPGFEPDRSLDVLDLTLAKAKAGGIKASETIIDEVVTQLKGVSALGGIAND